MSRASRLLLVSGLCGVVLATSLTVAAAAPPSISSTRQLVQRLEATLADQQRRSEVLSQHFDAVQARLIGLDHRIRATRDRLRRVRNQARLTGRILRSDAVMAYVFGAASSSKSLALFTQNATQAAARGVYERTVIGDIAKVESRYNREGLILAADQRNLRAQRSAVATATAEAGRLVAQNQVLVAHTNALVAAMSEHLRALVLQAAIAAAQAAARRNDAAGASGSAGVATQLGGTAGGNAANHGYTGSIAGSSTGSRSGLAAFHAAETQLGVPYLWGGEAPGIGFDCSGLTQWAWAQAGVTIPRTAAGQYESLPRVSLSALQPGDLLFYFNLDGDHAVDHVIMYGGSGPYGSQTTISAAHSGTRISLDPAFTYGLIGAARP